MSTTESVNPPTTPSRRFDFLQPGLADLVFFIVFFFVLLSGSQLITSDGDLGRHLTVGQYILDSRSIPTRDLFSYTMHDQPFVPHEWLSEVVFSISYSALGMDGVILLCAVILASALALVYREAFRRSGLPILALAGAVLCWFTVRIHMIGRPHLVTMLLIVLWVGELERMKEGRSRRWWLLPLLMLLWVNLHGAFIAGFVVWGIYLVGWLWEWRFPSGPEDRPAGSFRAFLAAGGLSALATLVNPSGWVIWGNSFGYVANRFLVDYTNEYKSPDFHLPLFWPFAGILLLILLLLGFKRLKLRPTHLFLLLFWGAMGLYSARNIPLFALISIPILAEGSADSFRSFFPSRIGSGSGAWSAAALLLTLAVLFAGVTLPHDSYNPERFPVAAVDWLEENPQPGKVFNNFMWGGYLLYRLWPEQLVFIDGQTDFYGEELTREYVDVMGGEPGWQDVLAKRQVDWAILPADSLAARLISNELEWNTVYQDDTTVILQRE